MPPVITVNVALKSATPRKKPAKPIIALCIQSPRLPSRTKFVILLAKVASADTSPLSPIATFKSFMALVKRLNCAVALLDALLAPSPNFSSNMVANLGTISVAKILPDANALSNCAVVIFMLCAAKAKAGGKRSPSCPRNSSALTLPLENIWLTASKLPSISSLVICIAAPAVINDLKIRSVSLASSPAASVATPKLLNAPAVVRKSTPSSFENLRNSLKRLLVLPMSFVAEFKPILRRSTCRVVATIERVNNPSPMPATAPLKPNMALVTLLNAPAIAPARPATKRPVVATCL